MHDKKPQRLYARTIDRKQYYRMGSAESKDAADHKTVSEHPETIQEKRNLSLSAEHVACDEIASKVAENIRTVPKGMSIGVGGAISGGKTTLGRALELAALRDGVRCHFSPEEVNGDTLDLYIKGQTLPQKLVDAVENGQRSELLRYNCPFYDVEIPIAVAKSGIATTAEAARANPYANPFQLFMLATCQHRVREACLFLQFASQKEEKENSLAVVDRTAWDNSVFEEANRLLYGAISDEQHMFYSLVCGTAPSFGVDALIYLDVSPEVTLERIGMRGSSAEIAYQRTYITYLHDIWFHRVVSNFCETAHRCPYSASLIRVTNETPFPIFVVPYDDFDETNVLQSALDKIASLQSSKLPRVRFYERGILRPETPFGENVEFREFDWSNEYASAYVSDVQRSKFKKHVMQCLADANCILFLHDRAPK